MNKILYSSPLVPCGKRLLFLLDRLTWVGHSSRKQQRYIPIPISVCRIFVCPNTISNARSDADACDCTRGLCGHRKRVCTESWLWEKNPLPLRGLEPASVLRYGFQSDAVTIPGLVWAVITLKVILAVTDDSNRLSWYCYCSAILVMVAGRWWRRWWCCCWRWQQWRWWGKD